MKKNIIGIIAVIIALSASAFTPSHKVVNKRFANLKWFTITADYGLNAAVAPSNAVYISGGDGPTPPSNSCSGGSKQCVSGFNPTQVTSSNMLNGSQAPVNHSASRN
jgi:hypothetical protein